MLQISAVIITLNEEKNISRCLTSLEGIVDEVVVVDSGSTDGTEIICREHGVRFLHHDWEGYGAQKNFGNDQAGFDWILSLDADEALSESLRQSILQMKHEPRGSAFSMNRLTNYCGHWIHHCGWYPDRKTRLFNRRNARWNLELVHEDLVLALGTTTGFLQGDLLHYSFYSREEHLRQIEKYSSLVARQFFEKGKQAGWMKMMVSGPARFLRDYLFRLGFLDGGAGFTVCRLSAWAAYLKYKKLRQLHHHG